MMIKTYNGIHTGFGCKVDESKNGVSVHPVYYEFDSIGEAAKQALDLLGSTYEVTVFSGGHYSPRSYHSKKELCRDFKKWL